MTLNDYFDTIWCINMDRSPDRLAHATTEAQRHNFTFARFRALDYKDWDGCPPMVRAAMGNAMCGCSHSHSAICHHLAITGQNGLILEDDFEILHSNFNDLFAAAWAEVPPDWDIVYLGCGYGSPPVERASRHLVCAGHIKTTSSYAISARHARSMAPLLACCAGPDDIHSGMNGLVRAYVMHPRLMGQYACHSEIWQKFTHNTMSMTDPPHDRIIEGLPYEQT
jgi:hypothetical protein